MNRLVLQYEIIEELIVCIMTYAAVLGLKNWNARYDIPDNPGDGLINISTKQPRMPIPMIQTRKNSLYSWTPQARSSTDFVPLVPISINIFQTLPRLRFCIVLSNRDIASHESTLHISLKLCGGHSSRLQPGSSFDNCLVGYVRCKYKKYGSPFCTTFMSFVYALYSYVNSVAFVYNAFI